MNARSILTDDQLVSFLQAGEESALVEIYRRYWPEMYRAAFKLLRDKQACEDIIQEIFIRIWDKREALYFTQSLKSYLYASVRYGVFKQIRDKQVHEDIFDNLAERLQTPASYIDIEHKELVGQISAIIDTLPERCREVYRLSREHNLSHKEISERMRISTKTVENQITKALRQLRTSLGGMFAVVLLILLFKK